MRVGKRQVFYIYAPPWRNNAAGVKVLYLFCHYLNLLGCESWIVLTSKRKSEEVPAHLRSLQTPILTEAAFRAHKFEDSEPIVVYSETVQGNPLKARKVIRYFLHYPGALGRAPVHNEQEWNIAYTQSIKESVRNCEDVLYIPAIEVDELPRGIKKKKGYFVGYAGKYRLLHGTPELPNNFAFEEIFRDGAKRQTRDEVLQMLAEAEILFLWENSSIAVEAQLLNTAVVFVPTLHLGELIASHELGMDGIALDLSEISIRKALGSVRHFSNRYNNVHNKIETNVQKIINKSLSREWHRDFTQTTIRYPKYSYWKFWENHQFQIALSIYSEKGLSSVIRAISRQIRSSNLSKPHKF